MAQICTMVPAEQSFYDNLDPGTVARLRSSVARHANGLHRTGDGVAFQRQEILSLPEQFKPLSRSEVGFQLAVKGGAIYPGLRGELAPDDEGPQLEGKRVVVVDYNHDQHLREYRLRVEFETFESENDGVIDLPLPLYLWIYENDFMPDRTSVDTLSASRDAFVGREVPNPDPNPHLNPNPNPNCQS